VLTVPWPGNRSRWPRHLHTPTAHHAPPAHAALPTPPGCKPGNTRSRLLDPRTDGRIAEDAEATSRLIPPVLRQRPLRHSALPSWRLLYPPRPPHVPRRAPLSRYSSAGCQLALADRSALRCLRRAPLFSGSPVAAPGPHAVPHFASAAPAPPARSGLGVRPRPGSHRALRSLRLLTDVRVLWTRPPACECGLSAALRPGDGPGAPPREASVGPWSPRVGSRDTSHTAAHRRSASWLRYRAPPCSLVSFFPRSPAQGWPHTLATVARRALPAGMRLRPGCLRHRNSGPPPRTRLGDAAAFPFPCSLSLEPPNNGLTWAAAGCISLPPGAPGPRRCRAGRRSPPSPIPGGHMAAAGRVGVQLAAWAATPHAFVSPPASASAQPGLGRRAPPRVRPATSPVCPLPAAVCRHFRRPCGFPSGFTRGRPPVVSVPPAAVCQVAAPRPTSVGEWVTSLRARPRAGIPLAEPVDHRPGARERRRVAPGL